MAHNILLDRLEFHLKILFQEGDILYMRGEGIKNIGTLFERYKNILRAPQGTVVTTFQEVVEDLFAYKIKKDNCNYTVASRTIFLNINGPLKTEIMLRKEEILAHLRGRLGDKSAPKDII